jgi:hypothetical protein
MLHRDATIGDGIHALQNWEVANAAARNALVLVALDIGKICRQLDTDDYWICANNTGPVWKRIVVNNSADVIEGTNLFFTTARVLATALAGLSTAAGTTVTAAHTILQAMGFLQKQATDNAANVATNTAGLITANTAISTINTSLTARLKQFIPIACSDETTALTVGAAKITFRMPFAMTLSSVKGSLTTAQATGTALAINVKKNGATIFSTVPTFDNTEKTTASAAVPSVLSTTTLAADDEITVDVEVVGDGTAKGLKVYLIGTIT